MHKLRPSARGEVRGEPGEEALCGLNIEAYELGGDRRMELDAPKEGEVVAEDEARDVEHHVGCRSLRGFAFEGEEEGNRGRSGDPKKRRYPLSARHDLWRPSTSPGRSPASR